jgi:hypothetical protein
MEDTAESDEDKFDGDIEGQGCLSILAMACAHPHTVHGKHSSKCTLETFFVFPVIAACK